MSATLDDPFLLSSYSIDVSYIKSSDRFNIATTSLIHLQDGVDSADKGKGSAARNHGKTVAVTTVQRSAVHLVDPTDQSPLSSFTISPNVAFTTPAVSVSYSSPVPIDADEIGAPSTSLANQHAALRTRKTFVGVQLEEGTYEVWCWTEQEKKDGTAVEDAVKSTFELQAMALSIDVSAIADHIVVTHSNGLISVHDLNFELVSRSTVPPNATGESITRISTLPAVSVEKLPYLRLVSSALAKVFPIIVFSSDPHAPSTSTKKSKSGKRNNTSITKDTSTIEEADTQVTQHFQQSAKVVFLLFDALEPKTLLQVAAWAVPSEEVVDVAFGTVQNIISVLDCSGSLATHSISNSNTGTRFADAIILENATSAPVVLSSAVHKELSLNTTALSLAQTRTLPLYPGTQGASTSSASTLFLLAAPQASTNTTATSIALLIIDARYGLIIAEQNIAVPTGSAESTAVKSTIPLEACQLDGYSLALSSLVASTSENVRRVSVYAIPSNVPASSTLAHLIGKQALTVKYTSEAGQQREGGEARYSTAAPGLSLLTTLSKHLMSDKNTRDVTAAEDAYQAQLYTRNDRISPVVAARILRLAVQPHLSVPARIVEDLIRKGLVADGDVASPGLTAGLLASKEAENWRLLKVTVQLLQDIPESALVDVLRSVVGKVDYLETEHFVELVSSVVSKPMSSAALRTALKKQMTLDEVEPLLYVLDCWLAGDLEDSCPEDAKVITFTQCIFDAHLVPMLQRPSLKDLIKQIQEHLAAQIALYASIGALKAPLDALSQAVAQMEISAKGKTNAAIMKRYAKDVAQAAKKAEKTGNPADAIVPEPRLSSYQQQRKRINFADPQQRFARKQQIIEERMLLGDYTLEEFRL